MSRWAVWSIIGGYAFLIAVFGWWGLLAGVAHVGVLLLTTVRRKKR